MTLKVTDVVMFASHSCATYLCCKIRVHCWISSFKCDWITKTLTCVYLSYFRDTLSGLLIGSLLQWLLCF